MNAPNPHLNITQWQVINTTTWKASDNLTVKNIASYGEFVEKTQFNILSDNFFIPAKAAALGLPAGRRFEYILIDQNGSDAVSSQSTFTEELQLQGNSADDRLKWVIGGYLELSRPLGYSASNVAAFSDCSSPASLTCAIPLGFGSLSTTHIKTKFDDYAFFAQATYNLTDKLALTGGIRYTSDKIFSRGENTQYTLFPLPNGTVGSRQACTDILRYHNANGTAKVVNNFTECPYGTSEKSHRPTWLINLDYKPVPGLLLYGKWARGYRQGGINLGVIGGETWGPEEVDNFEIGAKTSFRTDSVRGYFNIAGFYNKFRDQQLYATLVAKPNTGLTFAAGVINAGKSTLYGIEADSSLTLFDRLRFDLGYAFLHTQVDELVVPTLPADSPFAQVIPVGGRQGAPLSLTPKHRLTATATYTQPLGTGAGELSLGATVTYTSSQIADLSSTALVGTLPATTLLNVNVGWKNVLGAPVDAEFFATNVTNRIYAVNTIGTFSSSGYELSHIAPPRILGFRLRYRFGS